MEIDLIIIWNPAEERFHVWTHKKQCSFDSDFGDQSKTIDNKYGVIPYVVIHRAYPVLDLLPVNHNRNLYETNLATGVALTDFGWLKHHNSFKQVAFTNVNAKLSDEVANQVLDPSRPVTSPGGMQVLDMQANLKEHLGVTLEAAGYALNTMGIRPAAVRGHESYTSGYAMMLADKDRLERQDALRMIFTPNEKRLYRTARIVGEKDGISLPKGELSLEWPDVGPGQDPKEQRESWKFSLEHKLKSPQEVMREMGKDDESIESTMQEWQEWNLALPSIPGLVLPPEDPEPNPDPEPSAGE
jgi:hypothetical protein